MRGLVYVDDYSMEVREVPNPRIENPKDAIIKETIA